ncbi:MAG: metallophosphatase domain-containing protein [Gemmataceae bacterium]
MRLVAVADTHLFQLDLGEIPAGDVFIHAGDLLRGGSEAELISIVPWLQTLPHRHKIVVAGNHDWCFARDRAHAVATLGEGIVYLEDADTTIEGVRFWGSPWQPEFNNWAFNLPRGQPLAEKWQLIPTGIDVLITHGPPSGIGDNSGMEERGGCRDLRDAVRRVQPLLHLFGHIHQDGGLWRDEGTCFANVTTWEGVRAPTVLDLDVTKQEVVEVSVPSARRERRKYQPRP